MSQGQELFDFLLANTPDQVYFKDREGRFIRISRAVAEYLGVKEPGGVIGKTDFDFWNAETARAAAADEQRVMASGEPIVGKIEKLIYPNGRVAWDYTTKLPLLNPRGEIIGICGINKDFTKVKEMEEALREERNRLRITTAELEARNAQIETDLRMAREVQLALLPHDYRAVSHAGAFARNALSFAHCYLPAAAVGGDFFHIFPLPEDRAGVFICDVMGHGVRAALITAIIRALLEEIRPMMLNHGQFMSALNLRVRAILERVEEPFVATAFYAIADPIAGELQFANAAHPAPVRLRGSEGVVGLLEEKGNPIGPALGLFDATTYRTAHCPFEKTDRVVFFTDGAFEVDSPEGEEFGRDALLTGFGKHAGLPAVELFAAVLEDVRSFSAKSEFDDDVCLVACEQVVP
ncbi:MAG: phosphoserine phosphatase RsbU/P [Chthoniobacter sp.]|nr:phosphoserine phosphatase RsbU/P [Chthoniobacter sp.]